MGLIRPIRLIGPIGLMGPIGPIRPNGLMGLCGIDGANGGVLIKGVSSFLWKNKFVGKFGGLENNSYLCKPIISKFNNSWKPRDFWPGLKWWK